MAWWSHTPQFFRLPIQEQWLAWYIRDVMGNNMTISGEDLRAYLGDRYKTVVENLKRSGILTVTEHGLCYSMSIVTKNDHRREKVKKYVKRYRLLKKFENLRKEDET